MAREKNPNRKTHGNYLNLPHNLANKFESFKDYRGLSVNKALKAVIAEHGLSKLEPGEPNSKYQYFLSEEEEKTISEHAERLGLNKNELFAKLLTEFFG